MINVEVGMVINHPIEDVFAFVANLENLPKWDTDFQEAKRVASTPDGVGATYQCVLKYTGKNATQKVETTEYAVNKKITYESEPTRIAKARISIQFESVAEGTKITSLRQPEFYGLFRFFEPMMAGVIRKSHVAHLSNLKPLLEH
jgi:uncharacterized membrane protein